MGLNHPRGRRPDRWHRTWLYHWRRTHRRHGMRLDYPRGCRFNGRRGSNRRHGVRIRNRRWTDRAATGELLSRNRAAAAVSGASAAAGNVAIAAAKVTATATDAARIVPQFTVQSNRSGARLMHARRNDGARPVADGNYARPSAEWRRRGRMEP